MPVAKPVRSKIRVLIVDDIPETRENIRKLLYFEDDIEVIGAVGSGTEGIELVAKQQPDIVLMDINMPGMDGIAASEAIATQYPNVQVVMMSVQGEADYLRRSMLAGAREFLIKPFSGDELATSIRRVHQMGAVRRTQAPPSPSTAPAAPPPPPPKGGKVIAVFGTKGGCGASTIAVNLAVALRTETQARVALMDANLELGDIAVLLNLPGQRTLADLTDPSVDLDEELLNGTMAGHGSGIKVLLAPPRPEMAELISVDHIKEILSLLAASFDYVVVDVWRTFRDSMLSVLDRADHILLITTSDIPAVKNARLFFELTEALGYPPAKTLLVLNKEDGRSGIGAKDIEASVKHPVSMRIPRDDRTTLLAVNRGAPFIAAGQRPPPIAQSIIALARLLRAPEEKTAAAETPAPKKMGLLQRR
jgi:pilus assembly protein CpaE